MSLHQVGTPDWVYRWRLEAEHAMRASGRPGMTDKQARPIPMRCAVRCNLIYCWHVCAVMMFYG